MVKIPSFESIAELSLLVRKERRGFITNFFPDRNVHQSWIDNDQLYFEKKGSTVLLMRERLYSTNLYFITPSVDDLHQALQVSVFPEKELFFEIIGPKEKSDPILEVLRRTGFKLYRTLGRMWKPVETEQYQEDNGISFAEESEAEAIERLLNQSFDERIESIPEKPELLELIRGDGVLVCRGTKGEEIQGCLVFDRTPSTQHLRFWVTLPSVRDRKVGSRLMHRFFYEGNAAKRQILWVMQDNAEALSKYRHYGFMPENMYDFIMAKNI